MLRTRFFKVPRHKQFEYTPRFYNPDKEELEARIDKITREVQLEKQGQAHASDIDTDKHRADRLRQGFATRHSSTKSNSSNAFTGIVRLYIIITLLASVLFYYEYGTMAFVGTLLIGGLGVFLKIKSRKDQ